MAGFCGLKVLLLCAGIIGFANSITKAPPSPLCSYTVTLIKGGFQINILSSTDGTYSMNINEKGSSEIVKKSNIQHSNQKTVHDIKHLKPCTEYKLNVAFMELNANKETPCYHTGNEITTTIGMSKDDIEEVDCTPGYVCYRSDWNIRSSLSTSNHIQAEPCKSDNKMLCIKPHYDDICSNLTTTFTSGHCSNSFSFTKSISVDFLNSREIHQTAPTGLPAEIKTAFPPNCNDLTADYTCWEPGQDPKTKKLPELEPFTNYSCIGQIHDASNVTIKKTTEISFMVDCDFTINTNLNATNPSIMLSWTMTSKNCPDVLSHLQKLSYDCSCVSTYKQKPTPVNTHPEGETCHFSGLTPYTDYTCKVQPTYNKKNVGKSAEVKLKTAIGKPEGVTNLKTNVQEQNMISVTCGPPKHLYGPEHQVEYIARLYDSSGTPLKDGRKQKTCKFLFKDLSYSTTYTVKVTAFNGKFESYPKTQEVDTRYNGKALFGFLVVFFIIINTCVVLAVGIFVQKCRKYRDDVSEDVLFKSIAIYVYAPQCESHIKTLTDEERPDAAVNQIIMFSIQ